MGNGSVIVHMVFFIIFFLISFYLTNIFIAKASFNAQKGYYNGHVENQDPNMALILKKLRFLEGFDNRKSRKNADSPYLSPLPSPSPSPSPYAHSPSLFHHHFLPQAHKIHKKDQLKKSKRVLTAAIASVVGIITCLLCAVGLFLKFKKRRRRTSVLVFRCEAGRNRGTSENSVKKVSSDHLFYLDSLESALEQQNYGFKPNDKTSSNQSVSSSTLDDDQDESNKNKLMNSEPQISPSPQHIDCTAVQEIFVDTVNDKPFSEEKVYSSDDDDDQSFHSFCDSQSSQPRLSNATACSGTIGETSEIIISQDEVKDPHCSQLQPSHLSQTKQNHAGIPNPPPCPPPLPKSNNLLKSLKAPPPPPPLLINQQVPLGKDGSPLPKLKPLHWDKVRAAPNRSTVWDQLRTSTFEFDEEMIESLFSYNLQNPTKNDESKSKTPSPTKHVLDRKRLQNITILSKALNITTEQVCVALIRGDGLSLKDLEALSKMIPTKEEEAKLTNYNGDIFELGSAEKLIMEMIKIPFGFSRIEAMLYRETFEDEVLHLQKSFSMLEEACVELRSSRLFLKLLEAVLKTGNRMNVGTIRGGAKAFKLDTLLKLADVKGTDGKTTLLHFVVQEIIRSEGLRVSESIMGKIGNFEDKEENYKKMGLDIVSGLSTELCNAKKTATIDLNVLASSIANLSDGMHKLQDLVHKDMIMVDKKGSFVTSMKSFINYAEMRLKELHEDENRVLSRVREITEYFHGDVSKDESNPLRIFVIVKDFLSMLDNVCKELRSSKAPRSPNLFQ
ncbi:hypothetical protein CASFOL_024686 [Castilleja foliolosa]|uniref:Formin-like protein n=1 Tax=Castilleja foliolosa TaxID=1961234 RepID=A0ABD3CQF3_9LAMI